ncbi:hypothetical protein [Tunicatimonas pelagia]|uniref:hypothetical protein n=1 Tax=Tunicatimonas pelagia TaxID=931531 RepID=UPI002666C126|nr:hypothetical protein [Tunicatimonas pelagia]WKN40469.1 hypothetical protein P0M28_15600 [Tunicatimonas pelagia]
MKTFGANCLLFLSVLLASSFISVTKDEVNFSIKINGKEKVDLEKGISSSDLPTITIEADDKGLSVEKFDIILARGNRPVEYPVKTIDGNRFDLSAYSVTAKPGDRVVIELREIDGLEEELPDEKKLLIIPIK